MRPEDLEKLDIQTSYDLFNSDDEQDDGDYNKQDNKGKGYLKWIIIPHNSWFNTFVLAIYRIICMFSGYFYFYLAAFGTS